jgi:hypothetical protein
VLLVDHELLVLSGHHSTASFFGEFIVYHIVLFLLAIVLSILRCTDLNYYVATGLQSYGSSFLVPPLANTIPKIFLSMYKYLLLQGFLGIILCDAIIGSMMQGENNSFH